MHSARGPEDLDDEEDDILIDEVEEEELEEEARRAEEALMAKQRQISESRASPRGVPGVHQGFSTQGAAALHSVVTSAIEGVVQVRAPSVLVLFQKCLKYCCLLILFLTRLKRWRSLGHPLPRVSSVRASCVFCKPFRSLENMCHMFVSKLLAACTGFSPSIVHGMTVLWGRLEGHCYLHCGLHRAGDGGGRREGSQWTCPALPQHDSG